MQSNTPAFLKKKIQIGSSTGILNYSANQVVFHHDDISEEKRSRKQDVRAWAKQDALVQSRKDWNKSTDPQNPICERRTRENFVADRSHAYEYNYRAETLPPRNPSPIDKSSKFHVSIQRPEEVEQILAETKEINLIKPGRFNGTAEWVVHPKLVGVADWNRSTLLLQGEKNKAYEDLMNSSLKHSSLKNKEIEIKKAYVSPIQRSKNVSEEVRKLKASNSFSKDRPVFQSAEKPINRKTLVNHFAIEPSRKFKTTKHTGVWEFNAAEGRHMWSDTGSFDYYSRGDVEVVHNPDGYNFSNPAMTGTDQDY